MVDLWGTEEEPAAITRFAPGTEYWFLSNFYDEPGSPYKINLGMGKRIFPRSENAYQALKIDWVYWFDTIMPGQEEKHERASYLLDSLVTCTAAQAKKIGGSISNPKGRNHDLLNHKWEQFKVPAMDLVLDRKFDHPEMERRLVLTGKARIIEGNTWHDNFWGDCSCKRCAKIPGFNMLGLLHEYRRELIVWRQLGGKMPVPPVQGS